MKGMICFMAKSSQKNRKSIKRLSPAKFNIVEAVTQDVNRYLTARSRLVYSYHVIKDKNNTSQIQQIKIRNLEIQKCARELDPISEDSFFTLLEQNVHIFFLVKDSIDCGFAVVDFEDSTTAYIADLTVFKHLTGMGTLFYNMLENHFRSLGIAKVHLRAPFDGCKPFWEKMCFTVEPDSTVNYQKFL
jgi:hypothetical protein